jgi:hypothetical protein
MRLCRSILLAAILSAGFAVSQRAVACNAATEINGGTSKGVSGTQGSVGYKVLGGSTLQGKIGVNGTLCLEVDSQSHVTLEGYAQSVVIDKLNGQSSIDLGNLVVSGPITVTKDDINGQSTLHVLLDKGASLTIKRMDGQSVVGYHFTDACKNDPKCIPTVNCGKLDGQSTCGPS